MKRTTIVLMCFILTGLAGQPATLGADSPGPPKLEPLKTIRLVGLDVYRGLKPEDQQAINPEPVSIETDVTPCIKLADFTEDGKSRGFVFVTVGFIDLVKNVAFAKTIDRSIKGYFEKYILSLSQESGEMELKEPPGADDPKYGTEAIQNDFVTNFRQMVATIVAIKLAHHTQGHYKKYAAKLEDAQGKRVSINNLVTPAEWDSALKAGVRDSLGAGFGIEGIKALFEAIDKMPKRPEWTTFFLPATAKAKPLIKEMEKIEKKFFTE